MATEPKGEKMLKLELRVISHITDGKKWFSYKALTKDNRWVDLKFASSVAQAPQHPCYLLVEPENIFRENADRVKFPKFIVKAISDTKALMYDRPVEVYEGKKEQPKPENFFSQEE